ncbi:hypothetical protein Poli38472_006422 [Pythium oligandrum]|uniref:Uncharacterized protein n=1 Tax=Pythium oligandrum TaxID=41045 RepID=A0A8K1C5F8_PYTOL|nr:hypothetical protein Poli38472_006422 [Pythium oligandrum]|eukprot:TMW56412.1 hypothetical protein Poli38472_006422 [Pythium oligandrum]
MLETRRRFLNTALLAILVLAAILFVTTLFLLKTPHVGFNAFLTATLHVIYAFSAIVILNKSPSAFSIGLLVGTSLTVIVLSLQGAVFWNLAADDFASHRSASYTASVLHAIILVIQLIVTWIVVQEKEDVIDTYAAYDYIPDSGSSSISSRSSPIDTAEALFFKEFAWDDVFDGNCGARSRFGLRRGDDVLMLEVTRPHRLVCDLCSALGGGGDGGLALTSRDARNV